MDTVPGLRITHFVGARRSTRQVMVGEEPATADRGPIKEADSFKYSLRTLLCIRHYSKQSFGNIKMSTQLIFIGSDILGGIQKHKQATLKYCQVLAQSKNKILGEHIRSNISAGKTFLKLFQQLTKRQN